MALSQLVKLADIKVRFMSAPKGLETIFSMMHAGNKKIKRAAMSVMRNLCTNDSTNALVIARGGLRHLFGMLQKGLLVRSDYDIKSTAAEVIRNIANSNVNRELLMDSHVMRLCVMMLKAEFLEHEESVEMALLDFVCAAATAPANRVAMIKLGAAQVLINKLNTQELLLSHIQVAVRCLLNLSYEKKTHESLLGDQLLAMLIKVCYTEIPTRLGIQMVTEWDAEAPVVDDEETLASTLQTPRKFDYTKSPVHEIVRSCVMIVAEMSETPDCTQAVIDSTIVKPIIGASFSLFKADRKMARDVSTIMRRLTDESRGDAVRCQSLTAYGVLDAAERMVLVNDMRQKSAAVSSLAVLTDHINVTHIVCKHAIVAELVAQGFIPEDVQPVVKLLTLVCEASEALREMLLELGAVDVLMAALKDSWHRRERMDHVGHVLHALRILGQYEVCRKQIVGGGVMKLLFRISRLQYHPGRTDAKKIINGLGPEAAAFAIQIVVVNFVRNKRLSKMRSHMKQQVEASRKERRMAAKVKVDPPAAAK